MPSLGIASTLKGRFGLRAFLLSLLVIETLALASGFYWRSHLMGTVVEGLEDHVQSVAGELELGLGATLESQNRGGVVVLPAPESGVQILATDGRLVAASFRLLDQPPLIPLSAVGSEGTTLELEDHRTFGHALAMALPVDTTAGTFLVQAVTSLAPVDFACRIMCVAVPIGVVLLAAMIGWIVYRSVDEALLPVRRLAARAREMADRIKPEPLAVEAHTLEFAELSSQLDYLLIALRDSFEREQAFLDDASHDLRTPIAIARAELDLAMRGNPDRDTAEALRSALKELDMLDATARDLLVLARQRARGAEPQVEFDLIETVQAAVDFVKRDSRNQSCEISVGGSGVVMGHPEDMERALINLIGNGAKHGAKRLWVEIEEEPYWIVTTISDDGPGVSEDLIPEFFARFSRSTSSHSTGIGLGTAIAAEVIAKHEGLIQARNRPGGGLNIEIHLPPAQSRVG